MPTEPLEIADATITRLVPLRLLAARYVIAVLGHTGGNIARAAKILGVTRGTVTNTLERARKLGIGV